MLKSTIMNWAVERKLERDRKDDPMDIDHGEADEHGSQDQEGDPSWSMGDQWATWNESQIEPPWEELPEANSIGKGGKGKEEKADKASPKERDTPMPGSLLGSTASLIR